MKKNREASARDPGSEAQAPRQDTQRKAALLHVPLRLSEEKSWQRNLGLRNSSTHAQRKNKRLHMNWTVWNGRTCSTGSCYRHWEENGQQQTALGDEKRLKTNCGDGCKSMNVLKPTELDMRLREVHDLYILSQ